MRKLGRSEFEKLVEKGIRAIPEKFLLKLENVAIVVEDESGPTQNLLGLYEGVPQTLRGVNYGSVLPDKITIFQGTIEEEAVEEKDIEEIVKNTVWHEIAHHFGMDEAEVRRLEIKRREIRRTKP